MNAQQQLSRVSLVGLAAGLASASLLRADPIVIYAANSLSGGGFEYNLTVENLGGAEPLNGLLVLRAGDVLGLDMFSLVDSPQAVGANPLANWGDIAPNPPFVNILSYFSKDPSANIPIDGSLGGFSFVSATDPSSLNDDDFAVVGIGANSGGEIPMGDAIFVPEPAECLPVLAALILLGLRRLWPVRDHGDPLWQKVLRNRNRKRFPAR